MPYFSESEIARVEWRVRQLHEKIRELGGDSSRRPVVSQIEAALSQHRHHLEQVRSLAPGETGAAAPAPDFAAEIAQLRDQADKLRHESETMVSEEIKLKDELTKLNTEKMRRLGRLERLQEVIKIRRIDLERDLAAAEQELSDLKNKHQSDSSTAQLGRQVARKEKQLAAKEKLWYGLSQSKQKGSLTEKGRRREEQALKSEVRALKGEVRALREQLKKTGRVGEAAGRARTAGRVSRQLKIIAGLRQELADIEKDGDREKAEHDRFLADFRRREQEIKQQLARYQEERRSRQLSEQSYRARQKELSDRQQKSGSAVAVPESGATDQVAVIEKKIKDLEAQKAKESDQRFQIGKIELDIKVLERDVQMLASAVAAAEPQQMAMWQSRLRRLQNDFSQAKEDFKKLKS